MEKFNFENNIEQENKLPQIEIYKLTNFGELQNYTSVNIFSKDTFEAIIPINEDGDHFVYACRFLNPERAEEYFCRGCQTESPEDIEFWNEQLQAEKVEVLDIRLEVKN
nr:hypothetical protein [Streptococcus sanguinis]